MRLAFVVNNPDFILTHRLVLARGARAEGHEVHIIAPQGEGLEALKALGFATHAWQLERGSQRALGEVSAIVDLLRHYRRVRPDVVHHVTIKAVLYGSLAAKLVGVRGVVNAVSGLGYVFMAQGRRAMVRRLAIAQAYRRALSLQNSVVILQNDDDEADLRRLGALGLARVEKIRGSGVDVDAFAQTPEPGGVPLVVLPARLLRDKGVVEFVAAARALKARGIVARFALVGAIDASNPTAVTLAEAEAWRREGVVELWGHRSDMAAVFREATLVCLPSYREGLPKALLEAASTGRAIVTTDAPGCRDVVDFGRLGPLTPVGDAAALADAIAGLLADVEQRQALAQGLARRARTDFDERLVLRRHLQIWNALFA